MTNTDTQLNEKSIVLIIDDTIANIRILTELLRSDYAIKISTNGKTAIDIANALPKPDLILLDIMMPEMDGYEVCTILKADENTKDIPIIFVTAMTATDDEAKGLNLGAVDYITKPFNPQLVKIRIHNQLELKKHRDKLEILVKIRTQEIIDTRTATINSLAALAETRDPETGGHIRRTQNYVKILTQELCTQYPDIWHFDDETIDLLYLCAPLHDIGKVGVPDNILLKEGRLTTEEFDQIKKHTIYGYEVLTNAKQITGDNSFLHLGAEIALTHQEKWDGSGYPNGLKGLEIPQSGRLMALADVYDALISKRVYKPPMTHSKTVQIITEGRGSHFDPLVVDAFLNIQESFREIALKFVDSDEEKESLLK